LIALLAPEVLHSERSVLLVEPSLRAQLLNKDLPFYGASFNLLSISVVAYSELSSAHKADSLERIKPDLIIADEAHNLRHRDSARTKRFLRYMKEHPECRFVALSGTMTSKSIKDYAHLIELALRKNSPLPYGYRELQDWADALDVAPQNPLGPGALMRLCEPGESVRSGFRRRLVETHGVVATEEGALGTSLVISERSIHKVPAIVELKLAHLRATWSIGEEELMDAMVLHRVARQIAAGFYYQWVWPDGVDHEWKDARAAWHSEVRSYLRHRSRPGMDSPALLQHAAEEGEWNSETWPAWEAVKSRPAPPVEAVWLDDFLIKDVVRWAAERSADGRRGGHGGIVWYEHNAIGEALARYLPTFGEGEQASGDLLKADPDTHPAIACSIKAHGTGKNLQAWSRSLVVTPPANGKTWEQLLGRTHRPGQAADRVEVEVYLYTPELRSAFESAEASARYIQETQGQQQKLLSADRVL
jgi:hypothetical protein